MTSFSSNGLLAHLVGGFGGSRFEDLTSEALAYLLNGSTAALRALVGVAATVGVGADLISVHTQAADEDTSSRPDLAATDADGVARVLVEAKFNAGLTVNQPATYLTLTDGLVLFVVPARRIEHLWPELCRRAEVVGAVVPRRSEGEIRFATVAGAATMAIMSWTALVNHLRTAVALEDPAWSNDVEQFARLCDRYESETFVPFTSVELTSEWGRRLQQLHELVDDLAARAQQLPWVNKRGLRSAAGMAWYGHHLNLGMLSGGIFFHGDEWGKRTATPLVLRLNANRNDGVSLDLRLDDMLAPLHGTRAQPVTIWDTPNVPLWVTAGLEWDALVDDLFAQVRGVLDLIPGQFRIPRGAEGW